MKVLFIRHAPAGDKAKHAAKGGDDSQRPLTAIGRIKMRKAAKGLARLVDSIDTIATSPLVRARQTADIVAAKFKTAKLVEIGELAPDVEPKDTLARLAALGRAKVIAAVGHEPHLSSVIAHAVCAGRGLRLELKKGACCLVDFPGKIAAGAGTLLWALPPAHLRKLSP